MFTLPKSFFWWCVYGTENDDLVEHVQGFHKQSCPRGYVNHYVWLIFAEHIRHQERKRNFAAYENFIKTPDQIRELKSDESITLTNCIDPSMFESIISCTQDLGGFSFQTTDGENVSAFKLPSLPLKIGYSLEKCSQLLKGIAIKNSDTSLKMTATDFSDVREFFSYYFYGRIFSRRKVGFLAE